MQIWLAAFAAHASLSTLDPEQLSLPVLFAFRLPFAPAAVALHDPVASSSRALASPSLYVES